MTASNEPGLAGEIHLDVEYHMTLDFLVPNKFLSATGFVKRSVPLSESGSHVLHFFLNCLAPKISACLGIDGERLSNVLRHFNAKLVCGLPVPGLDLRNNPIPSSESVLYPPAKRWLFNELVTNRIFGQFNGVRRLEVL
jgi:hypothetical protein